VDTVIEYEKASASSVLKVDVQNLGPSASDLDVELLSVCDPASAAKVSRNCRANKDAISFTAPSPAGPVWLWVSTEATGEEFGGAQVQVTEIFPGPGESWPTAEPIASSSAIAPSSGQRLDAPSCFAATGNIHWYAYTVVHDAVSIQANAAGTFAVYDEGGQELACSTDAFTSPFRKVVPSGTTLYLAVPVGGAITALSFNDVAYDGVAGNVTDLAVTFPTSAVGDQGMAINDGELFLGTTTTVFSFAKATGALAVEHGAADGITGTHLGYDLVHAGNRLFSVDNVTTANASRLFSIHDGATWAPTSWDLGPTYPASSPSHAIATDGTLVFMSTRRTSASADFYAFDVNAPGAPVLLGTNTGVWYVTGLAADDQFLYVASNGAAGEGVYRLPRASIASPAVKLASIDVHTLTTSIEIDAFVSPSHLYVRDALGDVHAVVAPASGGFTHLGAISTLGTTSDFAMTYDKATRVIYLFETETDVAGRVVMLD